VKAEKSIAENVYIRKKEMSNNNLSFFIKKLEKVEQMKSKAK
jgi:hypothetical protein